ncbi:glycerate kinase [Bacillus sp. FJAT-50079]|uniref:glycerate kinase n=1 Tax=Bacillus sp. FJAT-50079 TaxID=2833577 RepID=UPI001BC9482F|nr:glycerate kinase [Bacillus sp. FJAT-50079]MBS4206519.1 glycerate kinase [Bacillus sp. FJAT-50079]
MKIVVAPDSFKGSLPSAKVGEIIKKALIQEIPDVDVEVIPMADGGEGTIDSFLSTLNGEKKKIVVSGPTGKKIETYFGVLDKEQIAVIEIASIAGFSMVPENERDPFVLTTYGLGECIKQALEQGYKKLIIGLGGSATNDGGLGMLQALGVSFYDKDHKPLPPITSSLSKVQYVDYTSIHPQISDVEICIASDVNNPLCGENGASAIFGPQKGATTEQIKVLDHSLEMYANRIEKHLGKAYKDLPGSGAAGGIGFALLTLGAKIIPGAALLTEMIDFKRKLDGVDWLITGEGKTDEQTLSGKLPLELASQAKEEGIPTILLSGAVDIELEALYQYFQSIHSISNGPLTLQESLEQVERLLHHKTRNIARLIKVNPL